jgi:hypothetical protein
MIEKMPLKFFASLTDGPSVFRNTIKLLDGLPASAQSAFNSVLATPIFLNENALAILHRIKGDGGAICFDSGGYYVQVGKIDFYDLYRRVLATYKQHQWADWYILPDYVPTSADSHEDVLFKVKETVSFSSLFFSEMPDALKARAVPVVHGRTIQQVEYCLEHYIRLGVRAVGFGSFPTCGRGQEANVATIGALKNVQGIVRVAERSGLRVHLLGLGAPSLVAMISGIGATSFDSASWIKSAGFGQVHLPFLRGYNITYRSSVSEIQKGITWERFSELKALTGHNCPYCESYEILTARKMHRAVHNLLCITEAVQMVNDGQLERINAIYQNGSPKYREAAAQWLGV